MAPAQSAFALFKKDFSAIKMMSATTNLRLSYCLAPTGLTFVIWEALSHDIAREFSALDLNL